MVEIQRRLAPLERLRNRYGEALIKAGLDAAGLCGGRVRPPRVDLDDEGRRGAGGGTVEVGGRLSRGLQRDAITSSTCSRSRSRTSP